MGLRVTHEGSNLRHRKYIVVLAPAHGKQYKVNVFIINTVERRLNVIHKTPQA